MDGRLIFLPVPGSELRMRAVVAVHPNNPTGSYVGAEERDPLNSFCREHGLALIVDEVFLDYPHDGVRRQFVSNPEVLTFTLSGVSKISGLPQMKLAWIAVSGPAQAVAAALDRLEVVSDTYLSMNAPIQLAAPTCWSNEKIQPRLLERMRMKLAGSTVNCAAKRRASACRRKGDGMPYCVSP